MNSVALEIEIEIEKRLFLPPIVTLVCLILKVGTLMDRKGLRLGQVEPRERAGAQTGRKYEYQYERTARAALNLLVDDAKHVCVYCDWHDDYVVEIGDAFTRYEFYQVKGRKSSQGPWGFSEFFGVAQRKTKASSSPPPTVSAKSVLPSMVLHHSKFHDNCAGIAFVTNAGLEPALSGFLQTLSNSKMETELPEDARISFDHIARAYIAADPPLAASATELFAWLRGLTVHSDQGKLDDAEAALLELANVVVNFSEIELLQRQAMQIAREIVSRVRGQAAYCATVVPAEDLQLRREKGIGVNDLLSDLSLSTQAYEMLKAGSGIDTVKTLSRLQRFCSKHGLENHIVPICGFKASWDSWRTIERHFLNKADFLLLESKAHQVLGANMPVAQSVQEAKEISKQFVDLTVNPLTPEHVMGLIFSLAAQSEELA